MRHLGLVDGGAFGATGQLLGGAVNFVEIVGSIAARDYEIVSRLGALDSAEIGVNDQARAEQARKVAGAEDVSPGGCRAETEAIERRLRAAVGELRPLLEGHQNIAWNGRAARKVEAGNGGSVVDGVNCNPAHILVEVAQTVQTAALLGRGVLAVRVGYLPHDAVAFSRRQLGAMQEKGLAARKAICVWALLGTEDEAGAGNCGAGDEAGAVELAIVGP